MADGSGGDATPADPTVVDNLAGQLAQGTRFAGYLIEGVAGQGGMGVVYRARQLRPSRIVALKVISPQLAGDREFRERFAHESEIAASIEHSNVIPVYEVSEESGLLYIVMRYVEGTDLRSLIESAGRLALPRAVDILAQLTAALDAAHERGLVHRDIKPANVLIARESGRDHVYLTDFGLAKLAAGGGQTRAGMFVGTLDYAAPEQLEGRPVDARTDVYATGCVLYHMLTGSVPFPHQHEAAIMFAHLSEQPRAIRELVPGLPAQVDTIIARAMAKDPDERYPSAGDLGRAAIAAAEGQRATVLERSVATGQAAPRSAAPATPGTGPRVSGRAAAVAGAALAAIVIAALAIGGVFGSNGHHPAVPTNARKTTPPRAPTTKTYASSRLGVSFSYPASWSALTLKGSPADFGTTSGAGETRCALEIERGVAPASGSQESQFAFVRGRSALAARQARHYVLHAIQAEQAANITGVALIRIADGQGAHLGFFFKGRDVYIFDCITSNAANLDQVDRRDFVPLLASVRIG